MIKVINFNGGVPGVYPFLSGYLMQGEDPESEGMKVAFFIRTGSYGNGDPNFSPIPRNVGISCHPMADHAAYILDDLSERIIRAARQAENGHLFNPQRWGRDWPSYTDMMKDVYDGKHETDFSDGRLWFKFLTFSHIDESTDEAPFNTSNMMEILELVRSLDKSLRQLIPAVKAATL